MYSFFYKNKIKKLDKKFNIEVIVAMSYIINDINIFIFEK